MTIININSYVSTKQTLLNGDSLTVIAGATLNVLMDPAIKTAGSAQVTISGYVYGDYGAFSDDSTAGFNYIIITKTGSLVSWDPVIYSYGGGNRLLNAGSIEGWVAVNFAGTANIINNSGIIQGQTMTIKGKYPPAKPGALWM